MKDDSETSFGTTLGQLWDSSGMPLKRLWDKSEMTLSMAIPFVEFWREEYKIRKVFG